MSWRAVSTSALIRQAAARCSRHGVPPHAWARDTCERGILGTLVVSFRPARVQVAVSFAHPRHPVDAQLLRLSDDERHRWPQYEQKVSNWVFPVMFGELAIMLWLIIMDAKERQPLATAA